MSIHKTRPIGEIFEYDKAKLQVVESETCEGCYLDFIGFCNYHAIIAGFCTSYFRDDHKEVIFKRIDK